MVKVFKIIALLALTAMIWGCDEDDDNINHTPAAGMGALGIDNETSSDIDVYINGSKFSSVNNWRVRAWDLEPGVYRLVLNDEDGYRNYSDDIDILADKVTELTVTDSTAHRDRFEVETHYDD